MALDTSLEEHCAVALLGSISTTFLNSIILSVVPG